MIMHLSSPLFAILLTHVLFLKSNLVAEGAQQLRQRGGSAGKRVLHPAASHEDVIYLNGTQILQGGHFIKDPKDNEDHPASIIWTGEGNKPSTNVTGADPDAGGGGLDLGAACFSSTTTVQIRRRRMEGEGHQFEYHHQTTIPMKELQIGDHVLTTTTDGDEQYEPVYSFAHRNPIRKSEFVVITTTTASFRNNERQQQQQTTLLELTPTHLVFLEGRNDPIRADSVKVGDILHRGGGGSGATTTMPFHVVKIERSQKTGIYAPLTKSGRIVVNGGIVASQYIALTDDGDDNVLLSLSLSHHDYIHIGLAPYRLFCGLWDQLFHSTTSTTTTTYYNSHDGMPPYIEFSIRLSRWVFAQHSVLQFLYMLVFFVFAGFCYLLETTTPSVAVLLPVGTVMVLMYMAWCRRSRNNK